jgi:hypothetical protein
MPTWKAPLFAVAALLLVHATALAQHTAPDPAETAARVPALEQFHEVVFTLWHTAWPNRDRALLKSLLPDVRRGTDSIAAASLPGILRDKQTAWNKGVAELCDVTSAYAAAVAKDDSTALFAAAERLHARYEGLVRVIRPALKELDEFHSILYALYHYHAPAMALDSIAAASARLDAAMAALRSATLPARRAAKQPAFDAARARLDLAVHALARVSTTRDPELLRKAIEDVHTEYQALESVLE